MTVDSTAMLINGLQTEFTKTYRDVLNRQSDSRLALVMDLESSQATNRQHDFGYRDSAPFMDQWVRGQAIPTEGMASTSYNVVAHNWGKRLEWHQDDREDDQAQSLMADAAATGRSVGLLAEEFFFDMVLDTTATLPANINAPDGGNFFISTARFGSANGNIVGSFAVTSVAAVLDGYYAGLVRLTDFQDTQGKPLWNPSVIDGGVVLIHSNKDEKVFEEAFKQKVQGAPATIAAGVSNVVQDASRNVTLWSTQRVSTGTAFMFLKNVPVKACFLMNRRGVRELSSLADMNNSDRVRTTGMEYVQWDLRQGAGINVPYGAVQLSA